jgi:hypothetical protein
MEVAHHDGVAERTWLGAGRAARDGERMGWMIGAGRSFHQRSPSPVSAFTEKVALAGVSAVI